MSTSSCNFDALISHFRIEKYRDAKLLDERGWDLNLTARWRLRESFAGRMDVEPFHRQILEQPIFPGNAFLGDRPFRSVYDLDVLGAWAMQSAIRNTGGGVQKACEDWEVDVSTVRGAGSNHPQGSDEWWQEILDEDRELQQRNEDRDALLFGSFDELVGMSEGKQDIAHVTVQMEAPDSVIVEHFRLWLASKRKNPTYQHATSRRFTHADLSEWAQKRILAYIDLTSLADHFGVKLTSHKLGSLIFPDLSDIDGAEKVRKTVAPLARRMMTADFVTTLHYAAAARQLETEGF